MAAGFVTAWYFYITNPLVPFGLAKRFRGAPSVPAQRLVFRRALRRAVRASRAAARPLPVEDRRRHRHRRIGPDGIAARVIDITNRAVRLQTGYIYHYAFVMLIGVALLITYFLFAGGGLKP